MNWVKNILLAISFAVLGGFAGFKYARRQSWLEAFYSTAYLRWGAPIQLSQIQCMQEALLENKPKLVEGAINDITVHTLIDAGRALDVSGKSNEQVPVKQPDKFTLDLIHVVSNNAAKLKVKPLFSPDAKLPQDSQWNPLRPAGFEIGKYFEAIMKEPRELAAKQEGK